jgi:integrase/recombinase XerD
VFYGQHRARLSRGGIAWIIRKYQDQIRDPPLADISISPHTLRHTAVICTASAPVRDVGSAA